MMLVDSLTRRLKINLSNRGVSPEPQQTIKAERSDEKQQPRGKPAYPYQELVGSEIRLLKIIPGAGEDGIECYLDQVPLSTNPKYYGLSYVWGNEPTRRTIMLDGLPYQITHNLYECLRQFRDIPDSEYLDDYFWVDAICINQEDVKEKSHQIPRMSQIYQSCLQVIVWLGPNGPPAGNAVKRLLRDPASIRDWVSPVVRPNSVCGSHKPTPDDIVEELFEKIESLFFMLSPDGHDDDVALRRAFGRSYNALVRAAVEIFQRPWFSRAWTIQEGCFDFHTVVYAGPHSLPLQYFISFSRIIRWQHRFFYLTQGVKRLIALDNFRAMCNSKGLEGDEDNPLEKETAEVLSHIMRVTVGKKSTDPRDQIYGILGLLDLMGKELPTELAPDYDHSFEHICWQYAAFVLESLGDLRLLDCSQTHLHDVPSWVPDFRYTRGASQLQREPLVSISQDKRKLKLHGILMGTVQDHIAACVVEEIEPTLKEIPTGLSSRIQDVEKRILTSSSTIRGISREDTLDGLMTNASTLFNEGTPDSVHKVYRRLREPLKDGGRRLIKRRTTMDAFGHEIAIAAEFSQSFLLTADGTILCLRRTDAEVEAGDIVCVFKGSTFPSVIRPLGEEYTFISQCQIRGGTFHLQDFDDEFWADQEMQEFTLV
ncbi:HET-domain-containing protein [Biscogniauxia mediterranea]|nr:HET-domain-containing protein [Biscogniauxia mediterranea]